MKKSAERKVQRIFLGVRVLPNPTKEAADGVEDDYQYEPDKIKHHPKDPDAD